MICQKSLDILQWFMYADDTTFYCNLGYLSEDIINNELTK